MNYVVTFTDKNCIDNILKVWLPTLQKNFSGKIVVIVFDVSEEHIQELRNRDVIVIEEDSSISGMRKVIRRRLEAEEKFINTLNEEDRIMLIDGADVVFQSEIDSFFAKIKDKIIYSTTGTVSNHTTMRWFYRLTLNMKKKQEIMNTLAKEEIKASGMLAGSKTSFANYFSRQKKLIKKFKIKYFLGINQAILTYMIYNFPNEFEQTNIHRCRLLGEDVIKENGIYKTQLTIPIIHFSSPKKIMKSLYKTSYLNNTNRVVAKKNTLNILWLYGSIAKWDDINHWYHLDFARVLAKQENVNLMVYGHRMKELHPDIAKIPFNLEMTGLDLKKEFDYDVIIMDNKNRFYTSPGKRNTLWLKPSFFNRLDNIPKIMLEGDYHLHFKHPDEVNWYSDRKVDLLLVRHFSSLKYHKDYSMPIKWFPCSVDTNVFKPNPDIERKNQICLIGGYGVNYYIYRNSAGKILEPTNLIKIYKGRLLGDNYPLCLQSYLSHISGSSTRFISAAKMFEIMASGSVLLTDEGYEYGLQELFPDNSYCTYKRDGSDVIQKAQKIINDTDYRDYTIKNALKIINDNHTHEKRANELINIITDSFGLSYTKSEQPKNIFGRIEQFFYGKNKSIVIETKQKEIIKKNEILIPPSIDHSKIIIAKNEELIKKLYSKQIEIYVLKNTCYNIIFNDKVGEFLDIAVDKTETAREILGEDFDFEIKPENTKKFVYKNMILNIPCPIIAYLTSLYGRDVVELLKGKNRRLRLIHNTYKFSNR